MTDPANPQGPEISPTGTAIIPARHVPRINAFVGLCTGTLGLELAGVHLPPNISTAAKVGAMLGVWALSLTPGWRKSGTEAK